MRLELIIYGIFHILLIVEEQLIHLFLKSKRWFFLYRVTAAHIFVQLFQIGLENDVLHRHAALYPCAVVPELVWFEGSARLVRAVEHLLTG